MIAPENEYCVDGEYSKQWHIDITKELMDKMRFREIIIQHIRLNKGAETLEMKAAAWDQAESLVWLMDGCVCD